MAGLQLPSHVQALIESGMQGLAVLPDTSHLMELHTLELQLLTALTAIYEGIGRLRGITLLELKAAHSLLAHLHARPGPPPVCG